jgi:16S rRNA (guanine966-N2)-methyltransferase
MTAQSNIRIIGGKWRSRKVSFATNGSLRPTPDRVRETLFNWLTPYIVGANCLDLYAGSGVLGFEALSRGAKKVIAVEQDAASVDHINANKQKLEASGFSVYGRNVLDYLQQDPQPMEIVFIDPPYKLNLLAPTWQALDNFGWVHKGSLVYFEDAKAIDPATMPDNWQIWRESKAGNVFYYLAVKDY